MHKVFCVKFPSQASSSATGSQSISRLCNWEAISEIQTSVSPSALWDNNIGGPHLLLHKDPYKQIQRGPQGHWACWGMHHFMRATRLKWTDQPSVVTGSVQSSRTGLCSIPQGSGSFWILKPTLGRFLHQQRSLLYSSLCCPIKKHYSPHHCWLRTSCIESTRFHKISVCQYGCPGYMYPCLTFYLLLVVQIHNFVM